MNMPCPLCECSSKKVFDVKGYSVLDCLGCSHRFAEVHADESHVEKIYDNSYFSGGGAGYSDYLSEGEILRKHGRRYAKRISKYTSPGRMLDVGAAAGFILQGFIDRGWTGVGLEPNPSMVRVGAEHLHLEARQGSIEYFQTSEKFDLISMIQVVAHLYQPRKAFEKASELLKDRGYLLVETWDQGSFSARILGRSWHEYSPPSVLHWFTKARLTAFLEQFGFAKVTTGRPVKQISGAHAKSLLRYRLGENLALKLIPDKVTFPYPSEDLFWALYQKF